MTNGYVVTTAVRRFFVKTRETSDFVSIQIFPKLKINAVGVHGINFLRVLSENRLYHLYREYVGPSLFLDLMLVRSTDPAGPSSIKQLELSSRFPSSLLMISPICIVISLSNKGCMYLLSGAPDDLKKHRNLLKFIDSDELKRGIRRFIHLFA